MALPILPSDIAWAIIVAFYVIGYVMCYLLFRVTNRDNRTLYWYDWAVMIGFSFIWPILVPIIIVWGFIDWSANKIARR